MSGIDQQRQNKKLYWLSSFLFSSNGNFDYIRNPPSGNRNVISFRHLQNADVYNRDAGRVGRDPDFDL